MPRNAEKAITPDFYRYTPNTNRSNYGSTYIHRPHEKHHNLLVCDHRINVERLKVRMDELDAQIDVKTDQYRTLEKEEKKVLADLEKVSPLLFYRRFLDYLHCIINTCLIVRSRLRQQASEMTRREL